MSRRGARYMNQSLKKRIFNVVLLIALTAFALWFALKDDYQDVLNNLKHLPLRWLFLILALGILYYICLLYTSRCV